LARVIPLHLNTAVDLTPLEMAEFSIRHKGEPLSLDKRPWLWPIYNMPVTSQADGNMRRKLLLIFGRQCEKSTTIGNMNLSLANLIPYLRALYVTASSEQMREFSDERLRAVIEDSPVLKQLAGLVPGGDRQVQNVQTKRWKNKSKILLRSVYKNPDRVRGIAADLLGVDELQDIVTDFLPVIEETLFHCEIENGPISIYSGTPKTFDNPLEFYWSRFSTQNEWMVRCDGCGKWSTIEEDNIGPTGLICIKNTSGGRCGHRLDPTGEKARWIRTGRENQEWEGFRLPQPIVIYANAENSEIFTRMWRGLLDKRKRYPRPKFANEVMARSYDQGTKPVTYEEVRRCAISNYDLVLEPSSGICSAPSWAGVDWGTGGESFTILSIWNYDLEGRFRLLFAKKYEGIEADPDHSVKDIVRWCRKFSVTRIGCDWGFGFYSNAQLQKAFGAHKVALYYHSHGQKEKVKWDKHGCKFITHRTRVLQDVFSLIKRGPVSGGIAFVNWDQMEDFAMDILAVYSEYSERSRSLKFDHPKGVPDDFLHTCCYALLASQFERRRPDLNAPGLGRKKGV